MVSNSSFSASAFLSDNLQSSLAEDIDGQGVLRHLLAPETVCSLKNSVLVIDPSSRLNQRKTPGSGSSDYEEVNKAAENPENADRIRKEMDILKPQLIICGGTFDFAKKIFRVISEEIHILSSGACYFINNNRVYLEFVHPMWFNVNRNILFAYAKEVFREVKALRRR